MDSELKKLQEQILEINARNIRVESDKAWETSWFRVFLIASITYVFACAFLFILDVERFMFNALIPVVGYFLSTQSLPVIRRWWIKNRYKNLKGSIDTTN